MKSSLQSSTITFLFTDIEGSTRLWQLYPHSMPAALARHHAILRQSIEANQGYVFQVVGDAFCAAFPDAIAGLSAALDAQKALLAEPWTDIQPIRVRIGMHTGSVEILEGGGLSGEYASGLTLSRVARLMSAGHGGQILLSLATQELVRDLLPSGVALRDMGLHRLKDLIRPEHIYQVVAPDLPQDFAPLKTLDSHPHNLPIQLTGFVGREREMEELKQLLAATRLLTLTGSGGAGKTRLALQVAADQSDAFTDGVWFVDLAPVSEPALAAQSIAAVLGVREEPQRPLLETLTHYLQDRELLLILDNCEHLVEACARIADRLLRAAPKIKMIATSREGLQISGETTYRVPSLRVPDLQHLPSLEALTQYEAVRLFVDRAVAVLPSFQVDNKNAPAVAQICHQLDGIPLAIELAAARVRVLSVEQIARQLQDSFRLLSGGSRVALPRQQTLRALIDWSFDLLAEAERILWLRLAVFNGGWTVAAAEAVCGDEKLDPLEIFDLLTRLADKSLVNVDASTELTRYGMLETIRQYCLEKLRAAEDEKNTRQRHLAYFLELAERADLKLITSAQQEGLAELDAELDNLRAALEWSLKENPVEGLRLANRLGHFLKIRGNLTEGKNIFTQALQAAPQAPQEAIAKGLRTQGLFLHTLGENMPAREVLQKSLDLSQAIGDGDGASNSATMLGLVALFTGEHAEAEQLFLESLDFEQKQNDRRGVSSILSNLAVNAAARGDFAFAQGYIQESVVIIRELGDKIGLSYALNNLGYLAEVQGDFPAALRAYQECLALSRELNDKVVMGYVLNGMGHVKILQGEWAAAQGFYQESLETSRATGDRRCIAYCLEGLAKVALNLGQATRAVQLFAAGAALRDSTQTPLDQNELPEYERDMASAHAQLDEGAFGLAWSEGRALSADEAMGVAAGV
jgi:predicted ATPase/class 3 adenylate cyclase